MRNRILYVCLVFIVLTAAGCRQEVVPASVTAEQWIPAEHGTHVPEKESPYTLFYENADGSSTLYLFTSPIAYYDEQDNITLIDNSLIRSGQPGMAFENKQSDCKVYFPQTADGSIRVQYGETALFLSPAAASGEAQQTTYTDLCGVSRAAVSYPVDEYMDIRYLPTVSGVTAAVTWREPPADGTLSVSLQPPAGTAFAVTARQDVLLYDSTDSSILGAVRVSPLLDKGGTAGLEGTTAVTQMEDGRLIVTFTLDESLAADPSCYPLTCTFSFELYRSTLIGPTVWSGDPDNNDNLSAFVPVGQSEVLGTAEQYLRFRLNYICKTYGANVRAASYQPVVLGTLTEPCALELCRVAEVWDKNALSWDSRLAGGTIESAAALSSGGRAALDITAFVQEGFDDLDWTTEAAGLLLRAADGETDGCVLSTSQNALYPPYIRIDFYESPWFFERIDTINPEG